ncbi:hypothetical protein AKJ51_01405 [candidate division MSBL1 archaeon SCGC-AAA382A20]|uniref:Uncharacterized protein n=1 Tax=candidate division MSBL1 archaeon SCGC-AAA382A20 TaxID=1698280 RepID=A0A133VLU9_9EURY|nr:hypothetical protein AKJ51_01405 [candidate division MSBL1 archaeon SCGC-AAA382A20]
MKNSRISIKTYKELPNIQLLMNIEELFTERERLLRKAKSIKHKSDRINKKLQKIDSELAKHGY